MMRNQALDTLRGLAVLLMILDHAAVVFGLPEIIRLYTRVAMPLFMAISGYLWTAHRPHRLGLVALAAALSAPLEIYLGLTQPGILTVWLLAQIAMPLVARYPAETAFFALVSTFMINPWSGYHPGLLLVFLALGRLIPPPRHFHLPPFALVGRLPLSFYLAHLVILSAFIFYLPA